MYLLFVTISLCFSYLVLYYIFPLFFNNFFIPFKLKSLYSIGYIILFSFAVYTLSYAIPNQDVSNRILHVFGGGFLAFFTCFLIVKDSKLQIQKFQFFLFSFLIVVTLGVGNEIVEFILQNYFNFISAPTVNDTWLDLISNICGALIAAICFVPFVKKDSGK